MFFNFQKISLTLQLARRDFSARYKGSAAGIFWAFLNPLLMLAVYSFVFSFLLKTRWGVADETHASFAVILFSGLILHNIFAEILSRAPLIIAQNPNYVKKIIFPLAVLPVSIVFSGFFHLVFSMLILFGGIIFLLGNLPLTALFFPLVLLPYIIFLLGFSLLLAAFGVFLKDIQQAMPLLATVTLFLSPILYPATNLPETIRNFLLFNPLTIIVENFRKVLIFGGLPDFTQLGVYSFFAVVFLIISLLIFKRLKPGFADVI